MVSLGGAVRGAFDAGCLEYRAPLASVSPLFVGVSCVGRCDLDGGCCAVLCVAVCLLLPTLKTAHTATVLRPACSSGTIRVVGWIELPVTRPFALGPSILFIVSDALPPPTSTHSSFSAASLLTGLTREALSEILSPESRTCLAANISSVKIEAVGKSTAARHWHQ